MITQVLPFRCLQEHGKSPFGEESLTLEDLVPIKAEQVSYWDVLVKKFFEAVHPIIPVLVRLFALFL